MITALASAVESPAMTVQEAMVAFVVAVLIMVGAGIVTFVIMVEVGRLFGRK